MNVEVLYLDGCPNHESLVPRLPRLKVLAQLQFAHQVGEGVDENGSLHRPAGHLERAHLLRQSRRAVDRFQQDVW